MAQPDPASLSIADLAPRIRSEEVRPTELVRACLQRIEQRDRTLNSFITVLAESALAEADAAEREIRAGRYRGPLHGIPYGAKDLLATRGFRTTSGSKIEADYVPSCDAAVVERLRQAGAILLGKTNLHEYAYGPSSTSPHFGPVINPWDPTRIAGGSSGGSAAAVAAGLVTAALGTDTGGSIRIPAALCGIVGLKPTYGLVSRSGATPLAWSLDHVGPMTRTVEDAALMLNALAGHDPRDPASADLQVPDYTATLRDGLAGLRVGIPRSFFFEKLQPGVRAAVEAAIAVFRSAGAQIRDVDLPDIGYSPSAQLAIAQAEALAYHRENLRRRPDDFGPDVRERLETALFIPAERYIQGLRARARLIDGARRAMAGLDVLLTPTEAIVAPEAGQAQVDIDGAPEDTRGALLRLTSPFNLLGFPALSVPCGFADGLPVGLQIAGKPFAEGMVLRAGWAYEQATEETSPPRPLSGAERGK